MSWAIGWDSNWHRDIGYGVPAVCDAPDCEIAIDRGMSYVCGEAPRGGEFGCGLYFCGDHLYAIEETGWKAVCARCRDDEPPYDAKPDVPEWVQWKLTDPSWEQWRAENTELVAAMRAWLESA